MTTISRAVRSTIGTPVAYALGSRNVSESQGRVLKLLTGLMMLGPGLVLVLASDLLDNWLTAVGLLLVTVVVTWISHTFDKLRARHA